MSDTGVYLTVELLLSKKILHFFLYTIYTNVSFV